MDDLLAIALEAERGAQSPPPLRGERAPRPVRRFGDWNVTMSFGRVGQRLTRRRFASADAGEMRRVVPEHLARRLSAPRRIGCSYKLRGLAVADGVTAAAEWVPATVIARLA